MGCWNFISNRIIKNSEDDFPRESSDLPGKASLKKMRRKLRNEKINQKTLEPLKQSSIQNIGASRPRMLNWILREAGNVYLKEIEMKKNQFKTATLLGSIILFATLGCGMMSKRYEARGEPRQIETDSSAANQNETARSNSSRTEDDSKVSVEAAKEVRGKTYVEIEFMRDSAELNEDARSAIRSLVEQSRQLGKIDEVLVLSWADEEYPSDTMKKLSKGQVELAARRNEAIKDYVKMLTSADVDRYNLAKQPNVFSKWFNTTDARLKNALLSAGLPTTASSPQYPSKASHSVIIVK